MTSRASETAAPLKVLFCVRRDLFQVGGGDATQILRTKAGLEELGVHVTMWSDPELPAGGSFDLAHLFHLTRVDTFVHSQALERAGLPFVLSTIYWPTEEFEQHGQTGALRLLHATVARGPAAMAKSVLKAALADPSWRRALLTAAAIGERERIGQLVARARLLLPNSLAEGEILRAHGATRVRKVVNATDPPPTERSPIRAELPERFVLSAGRIEPRKNQLALVRALAGFELPLVLVGNPAPLHPGYVRQVRRAAGDRVLILPAFARQELFALFAAAEAHVAPAWYETPGLVSLEAAAAGARVVTTDRGCTREYFGDEAQYLDPADPASMRAALERSLAAPRPPGLRERVLRDYTWTRAAEQTLAAYREALDLDSAPTRSLG